MTVIKKDMLQVIILKVGQLRNNLLKKWVQLKC